MSIIDRIVDRIHRSNKLSIGEIPKWIEQSKKLSDSEFLKNVLDLCSLNDFVPPNKNSDIIICIDHTVRPEYPNTVKEVMHPELERLGPSIYSLSSDVELYLTNTQKGKKWSKAKNIYALLKKEDKLKHCLGLKDAMEIQKKGVVVFRELFGDKWLYCWKSTVKQFNNEIVVPATYVAHINGADEVVIDWRDPGVFLTKNCPAACFPSSQLEILGFWRQGLISHLEFLSGNDRYR